MNESPQTHINTLREWASTLWPLIVSVVAIIVFALRIEGRQDLTQAEMSHMVRALEDRTVRLQSVEAYRNEAQSRGAVMREQMISMQARMASAEQRDADFSRTMSELIAQTRVLTSAVEGLRMDLRDRQQRSNQ